MSFLAPLACLQNHEKWMIRDHTLICTTKVSSSLKNLIDFNEVVKFTARHIRSVSQSEANEIIRPLQTKFVRIQAAIARQNVIMRLFLQVVLWMHGFDRHFRHLTTLIASLPNREPIISSTPSPQAPPSVNPIKKGCFINGGNTCFIGSALHCLNAMIEVLPKDIEAEFVKRENESDEKFAQRKQLAKKIHSLLEKSNRQETCSGEEICQLRELWHQYDPYFPAAPNGGDSRCTHRDLLEIFLEPNLELVYDPERLVTQLTNHILFLIHRDEQENKPLGYDYSLKEDGCCQIGYACQHPADQSIPLIIPIQIIRTHNQPILIPDKIMFTNSAVKYELITVGIGGKSHAYCYAKASGTEWVKYDDQEAYVCQPEEFERDKTNYGSILVYRKVD